MSHQDQPENGFRKKQILLNAFEKAAVGHTSIGQWRNPEDRSSQKHNLEHWIDLAKILERGGFNAIFLADSYAGYDVYEDSLGPCIQHAVQWPMFDPVIPISAMAAVTKNLAFGITQSTSFEPPLLLAKRFSTLDHMTKGRIAWNIVTSYKKAAFRAIGIDVPIDHDERYRRADEYLEVVYKLWESSWADDAIKRDAENDIYADPSKVRVIHHTGKYYKLESAHLVDPTPQRTPFLFQAGTSAAGSDFASRHAEAVFLAGRTPEEIRTKVDKVRLLAQRAGRNPADIKFFATFTPILGRTDEEAHAKKEKYQKYNSLEGNLVFFSGITGIDASKQVLDAPIVKSQSKSNGIVTSHLETVTRNRGEGNELTLRKVGESLSAGGISPLTIGSPSTVADEMERWIEVGDLDGFNIADVVTPGSFEDVVDLLIPELRRRGLYPQEVEGGLTAREKVYGKGQRHLLPGHAGRRFKYDVYEEESLQEEASVNGESLNGKKRKTQE